MNVVADIRHQVHGSTDADLGDCLYVWCPGCDQLHAPCIRKGTTERPVWSWDGNLELPTISPSLLVTSSAESIGWSSRCHSFIRVGRWEFLTDCSHALAGQTVDMVPLPDWVVE